MADMPADFWSGWIILLTVLSFMALGWLVLSVYFLPDAPAHGEHGEEAPVWDETLREGSSPAPLWWFWMILAAMVFSVIYLMLYPGMGSFAGAFRWSQGGQLAANTQSFEAEFSARRSALLAQPLADLAGDPVAMAAAQRLFRDHCSSCHGLAAQGQANLFPNLRDADWQWGGTPEQIEQTLRLGRTAVMVPWAAVLGADGLDNVTDYVLTLAGTPVETHPGRMQYQQFCIACHGAGGEGNPLLGAPRLNDSVWLYGGDREAVHTSIAAGRNGQMPAFGARLDDLQIRLLVAWLTAR